MSNDRRWREGQTYFTVVTHARQPILTTDAGRAALREAIREVRRTRQFVVTAIVLLTDHLHAVWELPRGDADDSTRWRQIKSLFTRQSGPRRRPQPGRVRRDAPRMRLAVFVGRVTAMHETKQVRPDAPSRRLECMGRTWAVRCRNEQRSPVA
jgi:REP element-mobilizing transposase RayT